MENLRNFMSLPIRRRGRFDQDDFFKDFHGEFDSAIEDIMGRHSGRSLLADQFSNYRKLKETSQDSSGPTASISETDEATVIVLDMSDFFSGSMDVRTRGHSVIIEASNDKKSFKRRMPLSSNTNMDGLKCAMSNDAILTITAPKKQPKLEGVATTVGSSETKEKLPLKVLIGDWADISPSSSSPSPKGSGENSPTGRDRSLSISQKGRFFQDEYFSNVWKDFEKVMDEMGEREVKKREERDTRRQRVRAERQQMIEELKNDMLFGAETKQKDFLEPTRSAPRYGRMNSYNNLRSWSPTPDTQAVTITQDEKGYKIVMDVKSSVNGNPDVNIDSPTPSEGNDLNVQASEGWLAVSGRRGSVNFQKEFSLKGLRDPSQVSASLSEDGILTITVTV